MTDPAIIKAVENSFTPLLIINNKAGVDAKILRKYKEPAWNYQVIRFLDSAGKDVIPRKGSIYTKKELASRMVKALEKAKQPVPEALKNLQ